METVSVTIHFSLSQWLLIKIFAYQKESSGNKDTERQSDSLLHPHFLNLIFIGIPTQHSKKTKNNSPNT